MVEIYRNPGRWRAVINANEVRHGTAGCLLSVILFAPLFVHQYGMVTVVSFVLVYGLLVVPAITNFYSPIKIIVRSFRRLSSMFIAATIFNLSFSLISIFTSTRKSLTEFIEEFYCYALLLIQFLTFPLYCFAYCLFPCVHNFYLAFNSFRITSTQVVFFIICEKIFCPGEKLSSLYFLLLYTILAYLHKSLVTRQWSPSLYGSSIQDIMKLTTWFVAARLAKGVVLAFVMIIFTTQFKKAEPNLIFILVTFTYFLVTQKQWTGNDCLVNWIKSLHLEAFEDEEEFWVPFIMKSVPIVTSASSMMVIAPLQPLVCMISTYTNLLVPCLLLQKELRERGTTLDTSFRKATLKELQDFQTCPVCLDTLRVARVTPCQHIYHATCLRKCIAVSKLCPLCKQPIASFKL